MVYRVQRSRARGWRMPDDARYVGRPSVWGNPFEAGKPVGLYVTLLGEHWFTPARLIGLRVPDRATAVNLYARFLLANTLIPRVRTELAGVPLVCWCPLRAVCHADVLLGFANGTREGHWEYGLVGQCVPCDQPCWQENPCSCCLRPRVVVSSEKSVVS